MPNIPTKQDVQKFLGPWIGESMGWADREAHLWKINESWSSQRALHIITSWEAATNSTDQGFYAELKRHSKHQAFQIIGVGEDTSFGLGILLDPNHFIIPFWDDEHDVIFSRPGVAELTAHAACANFTKTAAYRNLRKSRKLHLEGATKVNKQVDV